MLTEEDAERLIRVRCEAKNHDYKEFLRWRGSTKDEKLELIRDILGMANIQDGGKIIGGVRDADFSFVGNAEDDVASFDQTELNQFLERYTDPKHVCIIYKHEFDGKRTVIIEVPEFREIPIICKKEAHSSDGSNTQILKRGQIYIRTDKGSTEAISTVEDIRELMGRALVKKSDELLHSKKRLIDGKPLREEGEDLLKYTSEVDAANDFFEEKIGEGLKKYGHWELAAYPIDYNPQRFPNYSEIGALVERSVVRKTGWDFPHTDTKGNVNNFENGRESVTVFDARRLGFNRITIEGYRAYFSGLFIWKGAFKEGEKTDVENGKYVISFLSIIFQITEFLLFIKRYFADIATGSDLKIAVFLHGAKDRKVVSFESGRRLYGDYVSKIDLVKANYKGSFAAIRASDLDIAKELILTVFEQFNWDTIREKEGLVTNWQKKLIEGDF
ncbi:MAG: ATP-binding protein [bacterium]